MNPPDLTRTIDLVRRAQDGDTDSLNRLVARYYERVRVIVRVRLGKKLRSHLESGDVLQETFAVAVRKFDRFEMQTEASLINWLAQLAEHQISDAAAHFGALKRDVDREVRLGGAAAGASGDTAPLPLEPAADDTQPPESAMAREDRELVEICLSEMSEEHRELIVLHDYVGYSWKEIAEETGSSTADAARMRHSTAMVELAKRVRRARRIDPDG